MKKMHDLLFKIASNIFFHVVEQSWRTSGSPEFNVFLKIALIITKFIMFKLIFLQTRLYS